MSHDCADVVNYQLRIMKVLGPQLHCTYDPAHQTPNLSSWALLQYD